MRAVIRQIARACASATASRANGSAAAISSAPHLAPQRGVGRRSLPDSLETQASRPAQNCGAVYVSGSVARVSDFFLLLIHSLHEV